MHSPADNITDRNRDKGNRAKQNALDRAENRPGARNIQQIDSAFFRLLNGTSSLSTKTVVVFSSADPADEAAGKGYSGGFLIYRFHLEITGCSLYNNSTAH